jgi:predicted Fe-Mo cluster-binding NifX family protein
MRIAISVDENQGLKSPVAHHFGRCPFFALVDIEEQVIQNCQVVENPYYTAHRPGQVPGFIKEQGADVMLSGGMGKRALQFFAEFDLKTGTGAQGTVRGTVEDYLGGKLREGAPCRESVEHGHGGGRHQHQQHDHDHDHGHGGS